MRRGRVAVLTMYSIATWVQVLYMLSPGQKAKDEVVIEYPYLHLYHTGTALYLHIPQRG